MTVLSAVWIFLILTLFIFILIYNLVAENSQSTVVAEYRPMADRVSDGWSAHSWDLMGLVTIYVKSFPCQQDGIQGDRETVADPIITHYHYLLWIGAVLVAYDILTSCDK